MRTAGVVVTLLIAACATNPATMNTDDFVDRWAEAIGGRSRLAEVQSVYREGTIEAGGATGIVRLWESASGAYRRETEINGVLEVESFDGTNGWTRTGTAEARPL